LQGIITGVKMEIKEKRQEKGEEGCMERKNMTIRKETGGYMEIAEDR
jgi:hypothetical protein